MQFNKQKSFIREPTLVYEEGTASSVILFLEPLK